MIFETRCSGCDRPGAAVCVTCRFALLSPPPDAPAGVIAAVPFAGRARDVVVGLKYRNRRAVARHLGGLLVNRLVEQGVHRSIDVVTWAPTSGRRRRERGFDQSEVIARTIARQLGVPSRRLLRRTQGTDGARGPQTGRNRDERLGGVRFVARPGIDGRRVLVVDDVVTTGATLAAASDALRSVGADALPAAVAATPARERAAVVPLRPAERRPGMVTGAPAA